MSFNSLFKDKSQLQITVERMVEIMIAGWI